MAIVTISDPANHDAPMPECVKGTIRQAVMEVAMAARTMAARTMPGDPPPPNPNPTPVATVTVVFVPADRNCNSVALPANVTDGNWLVSTANLAAGTYTVVAAGSFGGTDSLGSDARQNISK